MVGGGGGGGGVLCPVSVVHCSLSVVRCPLFADCPLSVVRWLFVVRCFGRFLFQKCVCEMGACLNFVG